MRASPELDFATLYVFGAGGHGREIAWVAQNAWRQAPEIVFLVDDPRYLAAPIDGHDVKMLNDVLLAPDSRFVVGLGDSFSRRRIATILESRGATPATVVHESVHHSESVIAGPGAVIFPGTVLTTNVTVGRHAHVNAGCTVSHDSVIGDYATLSPGVHIAGRVVLGSGVFVGVGASIINGPPGQPLLVGDEAVIAAGACVIGPVADHSLVAGVPAVRKR